MTKESLKELEGINDLTLCDELSDMFALTHKYMGDKQLGDLGPLLALPISVGNILYELITFSEAVSDKRADEVKEEFKLDYLYKFNMYTGEMLRTLVELTLVSRLNNQDIHNGFSGLAKLYEMEDIITDKHELKTLLSVARFINIQFQIYNNPDINLRPMIRFSSESEFGVSMNDQFLKCGRIINNSFITEAYRASAVILIAVSKLKRSHDLKEYEFDKEVYDKILLNLWVAIMVLLDLFGHDWDSAQRVFAVTINKKQNHEKTNN